MTNGVGPLRLVALRREERNTSTARARLSTPASLRLAVGDAEDQRRKPLQLGPGLDPSTGARNASRPSVRQRWSLVEVDPVKRRDRSAEAWPGSNL